MQAIQIERNWDQFLLDKTEHTMLVKTPICERRKKIPHTDAIGMEDVRAIPMDEYPMPIFRVESIASNMISTFNDQDSLAH
jgi:hypothetical protein